MVFSGRELAKKIESKAKVKLSEAARRWGRKPKVVVIVDPANEAGMRYTAVKKAAAQRLGVDLQTMDKTANSLKVEIEKLNKNAEVDGIVIQLPFPSSEELVSLVDPRKDIDGLREDSLFSPAVVRAVLAIMEGALRVTRRGLNPLRMVVVGNKGFVGRKLTQVLGSRFQIWGMDEDNFDPDKLAGADIIISCTGQAGLVGLEMVKRGVVAIDIGYPRGDFDPGVAGKAAFFTPVPGGVGPVTVAMLFANLADATVRLATSIGSAL